MEGKFGLLAADDQLADTIVSVLTDAALRTRLVEAGLERAQDFAWERVCAQYEALYGTRSQVAEEAAALT